MAYQIDRYNRSLLTIVEDGTIDQTTDLRFIGKNFAGYGEIHNENFLYLLENFSNASAPPKPLSGQVWFDNAKSKLKFYDGTSWRTAGGSEVSGSQPTGLTEGDFWWDNANDQLYVFNGAAFVLVGPQATGGAGVTQLVSRTVSDTNNISRSVIVAFVNDNPVMVLSSTEFSILNQAGNTIQGFDFIKKGLTLKNTDTEGKTAGSIDDESFRFWGTASNADMLNGIPASEFLTDTSPVFSNQIVANDGLTVGTTLALEQGNSNTNGILRNGVPSGKIQFWATNVGGTAVNSISVSSGALEPAADSQFDLGTPSLKFKTVYADSFEGGGIEQANKLQVSAGVYVSASVATLPNTIAVRDSNEVIFAKEFNGTATSAEYADLAEKYTTDKTYPVGTIMCVGGDKETTAASSSDVVIGVVSENPAYLMNATSEGQALALKGRVPVRVTGTVSKGQVVYADSNGTGSTRISDSLVGVALEDSTSTGEHLVECVLKV